MRGYLQRSKEALSGEVEEKERELVELKKKLEEEMTNSQKLKHLMNNYQVAFCCILCT